MPKINFFIPAKKIAASHIVHGCNVVKIDKFVNFSFFNFLQAFLIAISSAWAVGSFFRSFD